MTARAIVVKVVDGDTLDVTIRVRVKGTDSPELDTKAGQDAKAHLEQLLPAGSVISVTSVEADDYRRMVAEVALDIGPRMIADGFARKWT